MQARSLFESIVVMALLVGCLPTGQATTSDTGDSDPQPGTSTTTGTPTTGDAPTTTDDSAGETTSTTSTTTDESTSSTAGETTTTTGDPSTGEAVACDEPVDPPAACTTPACQSVTRAWTVCDESSYDEEQFDYRFAADGSVLTYWFADDTGKAEVARVAPDGAVEVVFSETMDFPSIVLNRTAVNFSVQGVVEGASALRVFAANGKLLSTRLQAWCNNTYLVPDSQWQVLLHGNYLGEKSGCETFGFSVLDADGATHASWLPDAPDGYDAYGQVNALGMYYPGSGHEFYHRDLDGKLAWMVQDVFAGSGFRIADLVDRAMVLSEDGLRHVIDGALTAPVSVSSYEMRIAPHGEHSAITRYFEGVGSVHRLVDGVLVGSHATGFKSSVDFDVSDRGEVAVWVTDGEDKQQWIVLYDDTGAEMWRTPVTKYDYGKGLAFSQTGDELVVRERDTLRMFHIER